MKICMQSSPTVNRLGMDKGFEMLKAAGFDGTDFNLDSYYGGKELWNGEKSELFSDSAKIDALIDDVKAASKKYGIEIWQCHAPFPTYVTDNPDATANAVKVAKQSIDICGRLGCKRLIVHPAFIGNIKYTLSKEEEHRINIEMYSSFIPQLEKNGVVCCIENMWSIDQKSKKIYSAICADMNETNSYIDELNKIAGKRLFAFCLDIGHLLILGSDPYFAIKALGNRLETMHIHDNDGVYDRHVCPYMGIGDWERFCRALKETGYSGALSFEAGSTMTNAFTPDELMLPALSLIASVGRYFVKEISE